jgi:hypothetical protein
VGGGSCWCVRMRGGVRGGMQGDGEHVCQRAGGARSSGVVGCDRCVASEATAGVSQLRGGLQGPKDPKHPRLPPHARQQLPRRPQPARSVQTHVATHAREGRTICAAEVRAGRLAATGNARRGRSWPPTARIRWWPPASASSPPSRSSRLALRVLLWMLRLWMEPFAWVSWGSCARGAIGVRRGACAAIRECLPAGEAPTARAAETGARRHRAIGGALAAPCPVSASECY